MFQYMPHLVLTIEWFQGTCSCVFIECSPRQVSSTELTACQALGTGELEVVLHKYSRDLSSTGVSAGDGVMLTGVEMCLRINVAISYHQTVKDIVANFLFHIQFKSIKSVRRFNRGDDLVLTTRYHSISCGIQWCCLVKSQAGGKP